MRLGHWKETAAVLCYFGLLAVFVPRTQQLGWGMKGTFFCLVFCALIVLLVYLIIRAIQEHMRNRGTSLREFASYLTQGEHATLAIETDLGSQNLVTGDALEDALLTTNPYASAELLDDEDLEVVPNQAGTGAGTEMRAEEDLPEVIIEPNGLYLADTFQPGVNSLLGATILFCGIRRAGKSNGMAVTIEELARYLLPMLICDTEDEYGSLVDRRYLPRGIMAGSPELLQTSHLRNYVPIDLNGAFEFGRTILEGSLQVVLNLKSFATDDEAALMMCEIITGMNAWESSRPNSQRVPCMVFLDEASKWLPQNAAESYLSRDVQAELQKAFFGTMVRRGGKQGLGLALATQRIVELDKRALQTTWKFLFMQTEERDIERYQALGLQKSEILTLRQGECFIFSPQVVGFRVQMRQRFSQHLAHTPGLEQLQRHRATIRPLEYVTRRSFTSEFAVPDLDQVGGETFATNRGELSVSSPHPEMVAQRPAQRHLAKYEKALAAWQELEAKNSASMRDLAGALSIPQSQAYTLLNEMHRLGLIQWERKRKKAI